MKISKFLRIPLLIVRDLVKIFVVNLPGGSGVHLRRIYYRSKFKKCGNNLVIDVGVNIDGVELISVGDNVFIDKYCIIATGNKLIGKINKQLNSTFAFGEGEIVIGSNIHICQFCILMGYGGIQIDDNTVLSAASKVYSLTNIAFDPADRSKIVSIMPYENANFLLSPVVMKRNVWLGINSIVMPGVVIGQNSFCVSNSLLLSSFDDNSYITGQPAMRIRKRFLTSIGESKQ